MGEDELKMLLDAAAACSLDPSTLQAKNPFTMKGEKATALQIAVQTNRPQMITKWRQEAGEAASLQVAAVRAGLSEMTQSVHQELMQIDSDYIHGVEESKAAWEAKMLSDMQEKSEQARELREKQQAQFRRSAGHSKQGSQFVREWTQRWGDHHQ